MGFSFLVCSCLFCVFLSTKCLTTTEEGRKQHYSKDEEEEAGGTTQKKGGEGISTQEGQTSDHTKSKEEGPSAPHSGAVVPVAPLLGGAAFSTLQRR